MQPASFTYAPISPDAPDDLPTACRSCGSALADAWEWEEDFDEDDRRRYAVIVWFVECPNCGQLARSIR